MPSVTHIQRPWLKKAETQSEKKTDPFYHSKLWRNLRLSILAEDPLCHYCQLSGLRRLATIGDHYRPRKIFPELELSRENIKGSCDHHHNQKRNWERNLSSREQFDKMIDGFLKTLQSKK